MEVAVLDIQSNSAAGVLMLYVVPVLQGTLFNKEYYPDGAFWVTPLQVQQLGLICISWKKGNG